jgi:rubredoxin
MSEMICLQCGLIYDPVAGIPEHGIAPGTRFDDLPDDWECSNAIRASSSRPSRGNNAPTAA